MSRHASIASAVAVLTLGLAACGAPGDDASRGERTVAMDAAKAREAAAPGEVLVDADAWHDVDSSVDTAGLDVRFPDADGRDEVKIWEGGPPYPIGGLGPTEEVRLTPEMTDYRVAFRDLVFEIRARGTGPAEGVELTLGIETSTEEDRLAGKLEMEDAAGADVWIEIERARLLKAPDG